MNTIDIVITPGERDLGGFSVRRVLPYATHRMVGPFIFFDHMGPAIFPPGHGIDVRPHPHICLATVTYLFEGKISHRDSLGSDQLIEPGAINWMTAGHGIVHSERTPDDLRKTGSKISGIQCWVALPDKYEDTTPSFVHYPSKDIPDFEVDGIKIKLMIGSAFNYSSPVKVYSEMFYFEANIPKNKSLHFDMRERECAVYVVSGSVRIDQQSIEQYSMVVLKKGNALVVEANQDAHIMILGGESVGERFIYWNFVASSQAKIEQAKLDWSKGPSEGRFSKIPNDQHDFIPLPDDDKGKNPKGTIM